MLPFCVLDEDVGTFTLPDQACARNCSSSTGAAIEWCRDLNMPLPVERKGNVLCVMDIYADIRAFCR